MADTDKKMKKSCVKVAAAIVAFWVLLLFGDIPVGLLSAKALEAENNTQYSSSSYERTMLYLVNQERKKYDLTPITLGDDAHNAAAELRAEELSQKYSYMRPNGLRDFTVFEDFGITDISLGENYIAGCATPEEAIEAWMNIDFTRERILDESAEILSAGHYEGGPYQDYWVLIFSYPEDDRLEDEYKRQVLELVNIERVKNGLDELVMGDEKLCSAAQIRAEEVAETHSHTRPNNTAWYTIFKEYGIKDTPLGENAAWGSATPKDVVDAWMASEGHRANILNPEAKKMAVGYYYNSSSEWGHQWVQLITK